MEKIKPALPKILIVDDKPANIHSLERILENQEVTVIAALSGKEALSHAIHHDFALILMDVQMPIMDGFETAELLTVNKQTKDIPIIFITAASKDEKDIDKGYESGAIDYISKPIDPIILVRKIRPLLNLYRQKRAIEIKAESEKVIIAELRNEIERRNILEKKLNETLVQLQNSNTELEQFAYVASHDLQEPLRMVASFLQLLASRYKDKLDSNANEFIDFAVEGATRMQKMIQDLLEYSRIQTKGEEIKEVKTSEVLAYVMSNLQTKIEETGTVILTDDLPIIMGDESQLKRLFQNLIANAIKFCIDKKPQIFISSKQQNDEWIFSVKDNGIGIDEEYQNKVFQIFQRLHTREEFGGTGIGLAICKRIVERHNGKIWFESKPEKGTTFYFTIKNQGEN